MERNRGALAVCTHADPPAAAYSLWMIHLFKYQLQKLSVPPKITFLLSHFSSRDLQANKQGSSKVSLALAPCHIFQSLANVILLGSQFSTPPKRLPSQVLIYLPYVGQSQHQQRHPFHGLPWLTGSMGLVSPFPEWLCYSMVLQSPHQPWCNVFTIFSSLPSVATLLV